MFIVTFVLIYQQQCTQSHISTAPTSCICVHKVDRQEKNNQTNIQTNQVSLKINQGEMGLSLQNNTSEI